MRQNDADNFNFEFFCFNAKFAYSRIHSEKCENFGNYFLLFLNNLTKTHIGSGNKRDFFAHADAIP